MTLTLALTLTLFLESTPASHLVICTHQKCGVGRIYGSAVIYYYSKGYDQQD